MGVKVKKSKEVFYTEASTTKTYTKGIDWLEIVTGFDISNIGASSLTVQLNNDGITRTVLTLTSKGWTYKDEIKKVVITATDSFELLLRG